jgi:hypothetical protein
MRYALFDMVSTSVKPLILRSTGRLNVILFHRVLVRCYRNVTTEGTP